jgi:hypothetical protein
MVYDPKTMRWLGNEEDDVFGDIDDLKPEPLQRIGKGITAKRSEFEISKQQREAFSISDASHRLFISKFYPRAVTDSKSIFRDTSKAHLYDIRSLV